MIKLDSIRERSSADPILSRYKQDALLIKVVLHISPHCLRHEAGEGILINEVEGKLEHFNLKSFLNANLQKWIKSNRSRL